ncbi:hypothetical protein B0H14DRAFT_3884269 [Mycena olivaceomarginata]|nr:hypothetical protein B0H14DRAFT_3884269 [Mycena olivaceomarginata]
MARPAIPRATQIAFAIIFIVLLVFCLALPDLSKQKFFEGTTVIALLRAIHRLYALARDACTWLGFLPTREHTGTGSPSELGSAVPVRPAADQASIRAPAPPTFSEGAQAEVPTSGRLIFLVFNGIYLFMGFFYGSAVSSQHSALENTLAALLFVLGGLEVLFVGLLVGLCVVWLTGPGAHFIRELIQKEELKIDFIRSNENPADLFTKPLPRDAHHRYVAELNIRPVVA